MSQTFNGFHRRVKRLNSCDRACACEKIHSFCHPTAQTLASNRFSRGLVEIGTRFQKDVVSHMHALCSAFVLSRYGWSKLRWVP